jgi:farnesyl-diphosphate farnesyltransferase
MGQVSRSFAVVVSCLEQPLSYYMATAYLLCRVVDNIEDCTRPFAWKAARFAEFQQLLEASDLAPPILARWSQLEWPGLTDAETRMMGEEGGLPLWQVYAETPDGAREIMRPWVSDMADGMMEFLDPNQSGRVVHGQAVSVLARESDYNRYCYYVAGTVGHMATELVIDHYGITGSVAARLVGYSEACGRGLQKTNIIKDFPKDLARGISYLPDQWLEDADYGPLFLKGAPPPWKRRVIDDVLAELRGATHYVLDLPFSAGDYRMASLLCLLPAYQTLLQAAQRHQELFTSDHNVKISRLAMAKCKQDAKRMLRDNRAVLAYGRRMERAIADSFPAGT